jgi:hypothetical protein
MTFPEYSHPNFRPCVTTVLEPLDASIAIHAVYRSVVKAEPSTEGLAILIAQSALETANWRSMKNLNWGNSKSTVLWPHTYFRTGERDAKTGKTVMYDPPHYQTRFRAFASAEEGANHHMRLLMSLRYRPALDAAMRGDLAEFSRLLYRPPIGGPGYYTSASADPVKWYTDALVRRYGEIDAKALAQSALDCAAHADYVDALGVRK